MSISFHDLVKLISNQRFYRVDSIQDISLEHKKIELDYKYSIFVVYPNNYYESVTIFNYKTIFK